MKKLCLLLLAPFVICGCKAEEKQKIANVIIMSGQSNMEGHDACFYDLDSNTVDKYKTGHENVKIAFDCQRSSYSTFGQFVDVKFGQGLSTSNFGPEVGFASKLSSLDSKTNYFLIKSAKGSACFSTSNNDDSFKEEGLAYKTLISDIKAGIKTLKSQNYKVKITGLIWMQGENDGCSYIDGQNYYQNEKDFVDSIKFNFSQYIDSEKFIFVDGGISTDGVWQYADGVNNGKKQLCNESEYYKYISLSETLDKVNVYHYTAQSYISLGEAFAKAYFDLLSK